MADKNKNEKEEKEEREVSKEELQQRITFEISQTDYWIRKVYDGSPDRGIQKQVEAILQKLQSLQRKVDEAFQQENRTDA